MHHLDEFRALYPPPRFCARGVNKSSSAFCAQCSVLGFSVFNFSVLGGPRIRAPPWRVSCLTPPWASKINEKPIFSIQKPSKTFCNLPRALWKHHRASWSLARMCFWTELRTLEPGLLDRPASKLVPGDVQQHNHHKIITRSLRIRIETLLKPPATFPDISGSAKEELPGASQECFWTGLWTLDSGLPDRPASKLVPGDFCWYYIINTS